MSKILEMRQKRAEVWDKARAFLDERTNGLSCAAEILKGRPLCWQVTMSAEECERSALAMDAVKRM